MRLGEERSLAYHRLIAARLSGEPGLRERALENLARWSAAGGRSIPYFTRWKALLEGPLDELIRAMLDEGETGRALRQCGPFPGELPPRERERLWREVRERLEAKP